MDRATSWLHRLAKHCSVSIGADPPMFRPPIPRIRLRTLAASAAIALLPIGVTVAAPQAAQAAPTAQAAQAASAAHVSPTRPQGACDIYAAGGTPCVAAH